MKNVFQDYREEVIDTLCEIGGCTEKDALSLAEAKHINIEYGHKYCLSPFIIAGSIH